VEGRRISHWEFATEVTVHQLSLENKQTNKNSWISEERKRKERKLTCLMIGISNTRPMSGRRRRNLRTMGKKSLLNQKKEAYVEHRRTEEEEKEGRKRRDPKRLTNPKISMAMPKMGQRKKTRRTPKKNVTVPFHFLVWKKKLNDFSGPMTMTTPAKNITCNVKRKAKAPHSFRNSTGQGFEPQPTKDKRTKRTKRERTN